MQVKVYTPQVKVLIHKTIQRKTVDGVVATSTRYQGTGGDTRTIDLTPYLGEGSSVSTNKSVRAPAGGFAIILSDQAIPGGGGIDSLYGLIEPMDLVEIRMSHTAPQGGIIPITMRGFVSDIGRDEMMGGDGRPMRRVIIRGQDYGKLWQMLQIFYGPNYIIGEDILSTFKLLDRYGSGFSNAVASTDFVKLAVEQVINSFLKGLLPDGSGFPQITVDNTGVHPGAVGISGIQSQEGTVYNLLRSYMDVGAFNELFLAEDDTGVYCVYRQNPALDINGQVIDPSITKAPVADGQSGQTAATLVVVDVPADQVVSMSLSRTDANVANYYWVQAPAFSLNSDLYQRQMTINNSYLQDYPNSAVKLYGQRMMNLATQLGGGVSNTKSGLSQEEQDARYIGLAEWMDNRRDFLVKQNKDNALMESGQIRLCGNERIRAGNYIRIRRGNFTALYYVASVTHEMSPFRAMFTTVTVERGLGFVERIKSGGGVDSPYLKELVQQ